MIRIDAKAIKWLILTVVTPIFFTAVFSRADDTDVYTPSVRHNAIILLDTSDSMGYGIYEDAVDYHAFYKYICDATSPDWLAAREIGTETEGTKTFFYSNAKERTRLYLTPGNIGFANGMTGDAADPDYLWYTASCADMKTYITASGELEDENGRKPGETGYAGRISTVEDAAGETWVTLDGKRLPNNRDIKLHNWQENPDGSRVDKGFAGLVKAPGYFFSGYFYKGFILDGFILDKDKSVHDSGSTYTSDPDQAIAKDGKKMDYFFMTGNWINMQAVYNLEVQVATKTWTRAWTYCTYPSQYSPVVDYWMTSPHYPSNYDPAYDSSQDSSVSYNIHNEEASSIRLHFEALSLGKGDQIELSDESGKNKITITSMPAGGWTGWIPGNTVFIHFTTDKNSDTVSTGWKINAYQYQAKTDYKMLSRLEAASAAIVDVVEATRGKINWGVMNFGSAIASPPLNPSFSDDRQKESIINALEKVSAAGASRLGGGMQDVFNEFHSKVQQIHTDCNRNFVITLTDGYPDGDDVWNTIPGVDFTNPAWHDCDPTPDPDSDPSTCLYQYTQDPFQYATPGNDYYDDVARYMYTHSYVDYSEVPESEREISPDNVTVHNIGLSLDMPLLTHASEMGGGEYLTAFSKSQLVNAFYSMGLLIMDYTSYTAPVVSVDEANKVQSDDNVYMAIFKPNAIGQWTGNLKKYNLEKGVGGGWVVVDQYYNKVTYSDGTMIADTVSCWSTERDGGIVEKGGAGEVLKSMIPEPSGLLAQSLAGFRNIYTSIGGSTALTRLATDAADISNAVLGVTTDLERYKIINYMYGYLYDAQVSGAPVAKREWPLGSLIHSEPTIIDYPETGVVTQRYIAVGSNDGMLHVFDDNNGKEVFAFIPPVLLPKLKNFDPLLENHKLYMVDGPIKITKSGDKRFLIFGLRRGGNAYYALNITDENPANWTYAWGIDSNSHPELGQSWAEPGFTTLSDGAGGKVKVAIISAGYDDVAQDARPSPTDKNGYTLEATYQDTKGRGIYIIEVATGALLSPSRFTGTSQFVWPASGTPAGELANMKYCFPASPTVINASDGELLAAYVSDIYGQVWKLWEEGGKLNFSRIFTLNPATDQLSAYEDRTRFANWSVEQGDPRTAMDFKEAETPRKTFFSPAVSYAGNCYTDLPVLYLASGDRAHPQYTEVSNGIYSFYDAQAYYKSIGKSGGPFTEKDLMNLTCGALQLDDVTSAQKTGIRNFLKEASKGWYILFSNSTCPKTVDHPGEKAVSPLTLFAKIVYSTTFQPLSTSDPCDAGGQARVYAIDYCNAEAVYNYNLESSELDPRDRFKEIGNHIPSGISVIMRDGEVAALISTGGKIETPSDQANNKIKGPEGGMIPFYWMEP